MYSYTYIYIYTCISGQTGAGGYPAVPAGAGGHRFDVDDVGQRSSHGGFTARAGPWSHEKATEALLRGFLESQKYWTNILGACILRNVFKRLPNVVAHIQARRDHE